MSQPSRGEVWLIDLGYAAKTRPCLVVSQLPTVQDRALITIVPHTTSIRGTNYEIPVAVSFLKSGAFDCQNLQSAPLAKCYRKMGTLTATQLATIENRLRDWLAL